MSDFEFKSLSAPYVYIDNENNFRWKIKARNGEIIGASSEGFSSKQASLNNFKLLAEEIFKLYEKEHEHDS
ncbi:MAG: YegP family protein [Segetibacter sp.]